MTQYRIKVPARYIDTYLVEASSEAEARELYLRGDYERSDSEHVYDDDTYEIEEWG